MKVEQKKAEKSQIELNITITPEEVAPYLDKAAASISKDLKFKGFRPGKAPRSVVASRVGEAAILEEAFNLGLPYFYTDAIKKTEIDAIGMPKIQLKSIAPGNDIEFTATTSVMPEIKLPDYRKLKVKKDEVKVDDKEVQKTVDYLQKSRAEYNEVDREAKKGDRVFVDFEMKQGKVTLEDGNYQDHPITIGDGQIVKGFEDEISGLKKEATKQFSLKFPKDHFKKEIAGKEVDFDVKVKKVEEVKLPELNDNFAKSLGDFKSIDELKAKLKENIVKEEEHKLSEEYENKVIEEISNKTKVDVPQALIDHEIDKMINELHHSVERSGGKFEDYLAAVKKTPENLREEFTEPAKTRAKAGLIIREIAKREEITPSPKEVEEEINKILLQYANDEQAKDQIQSLDFKEYIESQVRNKKVLEFLTEQASK